MKSLGASQHRDVLDLAVQWSVGAKRLDFDVLCWEGQHKRIELSILGGEANVGTRVGFQVFFRLFSWVVTVFVLSAGNSGCVSPTAGLVPAHRTMFITWGKADSRIVSGPTAQAFA